MINKIASLVLFTLCCIAIASAQKATVISDEVKKNIQERVDNGISAGIVVGVLDADGTHFFSYGLKSQKTKDPVDEHSIFEIGSISKTFTGILLADMVVKGEARLDDPLQKYLPEGVSAPTRNEAHIQLVQMSNHTSGLPRMPANFSPADPANPYIDYSEDMMYGFLNAYELKRDIGSEYEYSNYAQGLLGHVLAAKNNMTYEEMLVKVIADPLDMSNTRITFTEEMKKNLAIGHSNGQEVANWDLNTLAGAGAIRSSAVDMLTYLAANMGKVKTDLYPAMELSHKNTRAEGETPMVGLGWHIMPLNDHEIVAHNGGTGGYRTFAAFIKGGDKAVVVLSNSDSGIDDIGNHLLDPGMPLTISKPSINKEIQSLIENYGIEVALKKYRELKRNNADDYDFAESELNNLGYFYMGQEKFDIAIEIFKLNVEAYPKAFNTYDSLGEGFMENGEKEKAIAAYKKSIELNPGNTNGIDMLKKLGVETEELVKDVEVSEEVLETYIGQYELMPGFVLTVTREGKQLSAQATGQSSFPVFPSAENTFYYKVVTAQLVFNKDEDGNVKSVTLFQGGQEIEGKKMAE